MTDIDALEESLVEWWKEQWSGIEEYEQLLTYVTFACVGFGLGGLFAIRKLIIENPQYLTESLAESTQLTVKLVFAISVTGIVVSQLILTVIHCWFASD